MIKYKKKPLVKTYSTNCICEASLMGARLKCVSYVLFCLDMPPRIIYRHVTFKEVLIKPFLR